MRIDTAFSLGDDDARPSRQADPLARLRALIAEIDDVIERCEQAHLRGGRRVTTDLCERAGNVLLSAPSHSGVASAEVSIEGRRQALNARTIHELMNQLWGVEKIALHLLHDVPRPPDTEPPRPAHVIAGPELRVSGASR